MKKEGIKVIASSERSEWRYDERENEFRLRRNVKVGDWFEFDGLMWLVEKVVEA